MKRFINVKTGSEVETLEEFTSTAYSSVADMERTMAIRIGQFKKIYKNSTVYISNRCNKEWKGN